MRLKVKLILIPFILSAVILVAGYSFLNWLLVMKMKIGISDDTVNIWAPMGVAGIVTLVWLHKRLNLLDLKTRKKGSWLTLYIFLCWGALTAPLIYSQYYLDKALGSLTTLDSISQIDKFSNDKYFKVGKYYVWKSGSGVESRFEVTGRYNEHFNMYLYIVLPILENAADTQKPASAAWYGLRYSKEISNHLSEQEKENEFRQFADGCQSEFDLEDVNQFAYLRRPESSDDARTFSAAVRQSKVQSIGAPIVLTPETKDFEYRSGTTAQGALGLLGGGIVLMLLLISVAKLDEEKLSRFRDKSTKHDRNEYIGYFIPRRDFLVTPLIIDANVLVFLAMCFSGLGFMSFSGPDLVKWGANFGPHTLNGEWWRLLTSTFLHGGAVHLILNMYGLLFVGLFLEPHLGKGRYAAGYLLTGIAASLTSLWWHKATVSVGASGAIFGLYGIFFANMLLKRFPQELTKALMASTVIFIGVNLLMGMQAGIDNAAHIGGLVSGLIFGLLVPPPQKPDDGPFEIESEHYSEQAV